MIIDCPSCGAECEQNSAPKRGQSNDGSQCWTCLKCNDVVCIRCYWVHTAKAHPEAYKEFKKK